MEKVALWKMHTRIRDCVPYMIMTRRVTRRLLIVVGSLAKDHKRLEVVSMASWS